MASTEPQPVHFHRLSGQSAQANAVRGDSQRTNCASGWVLGPVLDALFVANLLWPMLLLLQYLPGFEGRSAVQFWQLYFITTPHRWITFLIVVMDRSCFRQRPATFLGLAAGIVALCAGIRISTGTLTCLLAADYLWNAWHFAAQHHGIYRIYSRMGQPDSLSSIRTEKWLMRSFLLYVIFRTASSASPPGVMEPWLGMADSFSLLIPGWLVMRELRTRHSGVPGRSLYLFSVMSLYSSLLWAVHTQRPGLVLSLATASAWFHASEYLAVIGWHVQRRANEVDADNPILHWVAPRWTLALVLFAVVLGSGAWFLEQQILDLWLLINVIVAFLHYGYDGLIWKGGRRTIASSSGAL